MATNTILQSLNTSAEGAGTGSSARRQIETYIASGAIAAGDLVCFDITKTNDSDKCLHIVKADTGHGNTKQSFSSNDTLANFSKIGKLGKSRLKSSYD